jgi:hypothetical protein
MALDLYLRTVHDPFDRALKMRCTKIFQPRKGMCSGELSRV